MFSALSYKLLLPTLFLLGIIFFAFPQKIQARGWYSCVWRQNYCQLDEVKCDPDFVPGDCGLTRIRTLCIGTSRECVPETPPTTTECVPTALGCIPTGNTTQFIAWILRFAIGIGGGIAFLLMLFGVFQIITSAGDPERLKAGKELITSAVMGLLMIIFSLFLLQLIGIQILQIPGFAK